MRAAARSMTVVAVLAAALGTAWLLAAQDRPAQSGRGGRGENWRAG